MFKMLRYKYRQILLMIMLLSGSMTLRAQSTTTPCACNCLKPLFDYLIASNRLFIPEDDHMIVASLVRDAMAAGYRVDYKLCAVLERNINKYFYATTTDTSSTKYKAFIGDCQVSINTVGSQAVRFSTLKSGSCETSGTVPYYNVSGGTGTPLARLQVDFCNKCTPVASGICYSAITDTSVNPYTYNLAGNWKPSKSYAYYAARTESDPAQATNIRQDGTIKDFAAFWTTQTNGWAAVQDTTRWVWNTVVTLFNQKGLELENKDALGRFNSGLYGYGDALPVAVTQNSRYQEAAYEGFEDYGFGMNICDTACLGNRSFDFSAYKNNIDSSQQHTGKYSLRVEGNSSIGISAQLSTPTDNPFALNINKELYQCAPWGGGVASLKSIRTEKEALLPVFSPMPGKKVLVSAWVKEEKDCLNLTYEHTQISIVIARQGLSNVTVIAKPSGNIIEGWQRFEQVVDVPANATVLSVNLQSTGNGKAYFDDVRVHPYNANMKSFVYHQQSLLLMAELDENNYATFYEYDDDGTLIRLKKETERGVKTIKETRSGLLKEQIL
jgi:hypothetical protein